MLSGLNALTQLHINAIEPPPKPREPSAIPVLPLFPDAACQALAHACTLRPRTGMRASPHSARESVGRAVISVNAQRRHRRSRRTREAHMCHRYLRRCVPPSRWTCATCRICRTSSPVPSRNHLVLVHHQTRLLVLPQVCVSLQRCANQPCVQCRSIATEHCRSHHAFMLVCRPHLTLLVMARLLPLLHDCVLPSCKFVGQQPVWQALQADARMNTPQPQKPSRYLCRFQAEPRMVKFDCVPVTLTDLGRLNAVRLNGCISLRHGLPPLCPLTRLHSLHLEARNSSSPLLSNSTLLWDVWTHICLRARKMHTCGNVSRRPQSGVPPSDSLHAPVTCWCTTHDFCCCI